MPYSSTPDPYIDSETGVLKNLLGISSNEELDVAVADITAVVIASMPDESLGIQCRTPGEMLRRW